ncbi:hypothetical protein [Actinomadura rugatobispora]|uniref:Uncharacterized protein n=1 Tax=Actinomadura rugatobispora TaxID=1994 RepID=A0ABW0ZW43_9ACTN|nr:hypothetical protein GCM10010200_111250 [Actinomadura rugatobispora]
MVGLEQGAWLSKKSLQIGTVAALSLSALGVPAAWPFVPPLYVHQYDPQAFWDGGMAWAEAGRQVRTARERIERLVDGIEEEGWRSEDGRAFKQRMDRFLQDLLSMEIRAAVTAAVLFMAAVLVMAMILFMALIAAVLVALAAWLAIATITPMSAAAARLSAIGTLASVNAALKSVESALATVLHTCAGILGALVAGDVLAEAAQGDFSGVRDFVSATVAQGPMLIWGTLNRVERDATAYGLGGRFPADGFYGWLSRGRAGADLPAGWTQAAGAKGFYETQYNEGGQAITGGLAPEQDTDGSYRYPWE